MDILPEILGKMSRKISEEIDEFPKKTWEILRNHTCKNLKKKVLKKREKG